VTVFHLFFRGLPLNAITFISDLPCPTELLIGKSIMINPSSPVGKSARYLS